MYQSLSWKQNWGTFISRTVNPIPWSSHLLINSVFHRGTRSPKKCVARRPLPPRVSIFSYVMLITPFPRQQFKLRNFGNE